MVFAECSIHDAAAADLTCRSALPRQFTGEWAQGDLSRRYRSGEVSLNEAVQAVPAVQPLALRLLKKFVLIWRDLDSYATFDRCWIHGAAAARGFRLAARSNVQSSNKKA